MTVLDDAFLAAWTEAGGASFARVENAAAGPTPVRVVLHRGLRAKSSKTPQNMLQNYGAKIHAFFGFCTMKIGYARVSTDEQETHL